MILGVAGFRVFEEIGNNFCYVSDKILFLQIS